jgi:hypothetical protein
MDAKGVALLVAFALGTPAVTLSADMSAGRDGIADGQQAGPPTARTPVRRRDAQQSERKASLGAHPDERAANTGRHRQARAAQHYRGNRAIPRHGGRYAVLLAPGARLTLRGLEINWWRGKDAGEIAFEIEFADDARLGAEIMASWFDRGSPDTWVSRCRYEVGTPHCEPHGCRRERSRAVTGRCRPYPDQVGARALIMHDAVWLNANLATMREGEFPTAQFRDGAIAVKAGRIAWVGPRKEWKDKAAIEHDARWRVDHAGLGRLPHASCLRGEPGG